MRVAFCGALPAAFADPVRARLAVPCEFIVADQTTLMPRLAEVDVLVTLVFTAAMGARAGRLRLVQVPGAGLDNIDASALPPGAALANAYGHETGIAEYVIGAMLALNRGFARLDAALRAGVWESHWAVGPQPARLWQELAGKTLGILGYGHIGQAVARRARAFDMNVRAIRRNADRCSGREFARVEGSEMLGELLASSDFLVVTLPLTPETRGLLGAREFGAMKPTAILVNVARGEILDEDALFTALAERRISAAALDVWYRYPTSPEPTLPSRRAFHQLPNVLMTPHVAGATGGTVATRAKLIAENIDRIARGALPLNLVRAPEHVATPAASGSQQASN